MKQPLEYTRSALAKSQKATEKSMELTHSIIEKSKKLRTPSTKIDKIGTAVTGLASVGCVGVGVVQIFLGKPLWAVGTVSLGAIALISNRIHHHKIKNRY